jgi:hypothetical protein
VDVEPVGREGEQVNNLENAELAASQWRLRFSGVVQRLEDVVARNRTLEAELAAEERDHERALSLMEAALDERDQLRELLNALVPNAVLNAHPDYREEWKP